MTKTAQDVKGITTNRRAPVVEPKEFNPARKHMSYEDALKDNKARKAAIEAADEAYKKVMRERGAGTKSVAVEEKPDTTDIEAKLASKREALVRAEAGLKEDPKSSGLEKTINKLNTEIDQLEDELG